MADEPSGAGWYLSLGGDPQGPNDPAEVEAWYREGRIGPAALLWDGSAWRPVGEVFAPPAPAGGARPRPPLTPEAERAAIERALSYTLPRPAAAPHRSPLSLAIFFVTLLVASLVLFLAARRLLPPDGSPAAPVAAAPPADPAGAVGAIGAALSIREDVRTKNLETGLLIVLSDGRLFGADLEDAVEAPRALPSDLVRSLPEIRSPWGNPALYLRREGALRLLLPLGEGGRAGAVVGDPATGGVWRVDRPAASLSLWDVLDVPPDAGGL